MQKIKIKWLLATEMTKFCAMRYKANNGGDIPLLFDLYMSIASNLAVYGLFYC